MTNKPTPDQLRAARLAAGLSQEDAGELILGSRRSWENWEQGRVKMHPGLFDYFMIKTGQKTYFDEQTYINDCFVG